MIRHYPCSDYSEQACRAALEQCADLSFVTPGMTVGIKVNLVHAAKPEAAATTHPMLLKVLTDLLKEHGAARVILGDSPGGLYNQAALETVYRVCGLEQTGAELNRNFSVKKAELPGKVLHRCTYTAWLDSCDAVINFSKLKTHGMMGMTAAVKNLFGIIPGTMKPEYHYRFPEPMDFAHMLIDLQEFVKPKLHLVDAVMCMEGNGPTAGTPRHMGLVLGGDDPYELDAVCQALIGAPRVLTQTAAAERGLFTQEPLPAWAEQFALQDFKLPPIHRNIFEVVFPGKAGQLLDKTAHALIAPRPTLESSLCIGCRKCEGMCPAKAIGMKNGKPKIDRSKCIGCFCCQEFCPRGALEAKRPFIARLLVREHS